MCFVVRFVLVYDLRKKEVTTSTSDVQCFFLGTGVYTSHNHFLFHFPEKSCVSESRVYCVPSLRPEHTCESHVHCFFTGD